MLFLNAIACERDLDLCHFDVNQASVQSALKEGVFCDCPKDVAIFQER